jgi:hypothetical protein
MTPSIVPGRHPKAPDTIAGLTLAGAHQRDADGPLVGCLGELVRTPCSLALEGDASTASRDHAYLRSPLLRKDLDKIR